jgi:hypothetical protein
MGASESFERRSADGVARPFSFRLDDGRTLWTMRPGHAPWRGRPSRRARRRSQRTGRRRARRPVAAVVVAAAAARPAAGAGLVIVLVVLFLAVAAGAYPSFAA